LEDLIPDNVLNELKGLGYLDTNGLFNFSDRFIAKMSGTTPSGNSCPNVWNAIRHYGMIAEADWPSVWSTWGVYYQGIPQTLKDKALKFLQYFDVQYEYIVNGGHLDLTTAKYHLKQAPIQIATATCSGWSTSPVIQACNEPIAHATCLFGADTTFWDFDSYDPFKKQLSGTYIIPIAMKGLIVPKFNFKKKIMAKLERKKGTQAVFLNLNGVRYWIKDITDFENIQKEQPITISWADVKEVDAFSAPYGGEIVGKANLADALKVLFGGVK